MSELNDRDSFCNSNKNLDGLRLLKDNYSTVSTITSTRKMTMEYDRLKSDKFELEDTLVNYKLRYAEESSKRMDFEDKLTLLTIEYKKLEKNFNSVNEALKYKDDIIDQLIKQKDDLNKKVIKKGHTFSVNMIGDVIGVDKKSVINESSVCSEITDRTMKSPISVRDKADFTPNTSRINPLDNSSPIRQGKKGITGFMKNLFNK
jgi:hypothetical protein